MGYRAQKDELQRRKRLAKRIALCICICLLVAGIIFACIVPPETWKYYFRKPDVSKRRAGELRVHFIDVGQGDSTLIELPDGKVMLVDGGNDSDRAKSAVMRYLNALDIDVIDYLVVTHTDSDHSGGVDEVARFKKVLNAYLPRSFTSLDVEYMEAYEALSKRDCALYTAQRGIRFTSSNPSYPYDLRFLYPYADETQTDDEEEEKEEDNDTSAILWLEYFGSGVLLLGDASAKLEKQLVAEAKLGLFKSVDITKTTVLKAAHHGSGDSSCSELLEYIGAEAAVISCGASNPYGHPALSALERLESVGAQIYRTDRQGNILLTLGADGKWAFAG